MRPEDNTHSRCVHTQHTFQVCTYPTHIPGVYIPNTHSRCVHTQHTFQVCTYPTHIPGVYIPNTHSRCVHTQHTLQVCTYPTHIPGVYIPNTHSMCILRIGRIFDPYSKFRIFEHFLAIRFETRSYKRILLKYVLSCPPQQNCRVLHEFVFFILFFTGM